MAKSHKETAGKSKPENAPTKSLNFRVSSVFHREFKTYAAERGMSMLAVLLAAFHSLKQSK
jgi:hypothetical protein